MAESTDQSGDDAFIHSSSFTYFIPLATDYDVVKALKESGVPHQEALKSIESRDSLFFDELVDVFLVLRTPILESSILEPLLKKVVVSLDVQIANRIPDRDSPPATETIYSGTLEDTDDLVIVTDEGGQDDDEDEDKPERFTHVVWKLSVSLVRPRIRLQGPSAVFTATASLKPQDLARSNGLPSGYMQSGVSSGLNLLESFSHDPALNGVKPRLSALRVSRVAPVTRQSKDLLQPIKSTPRHLSFRIYPTMHSRLRFARPNTTPPSSSIIAMLEIDFTPFFDCEMALTSISMSVPKAMVEDLTSQPAMALPLSCVAHDHVTFLYRIAPEEADVLSKNPTRDLNITILAKALVQPGICTPKLTMAWKSTLDFTLPVNPGYGSAMQPIQRSHRPSQLSINSMTSFTAPSVARPDALPSLEAATTRTETAIPDLGITMTFTAPPPSRKIYPGDEFVWTVFVVNRSPPTSTMPPRKLALVAIPKRRRNESRVNRPPSISHPAPAPSRGPSRPKTPRDRSVADAVVDENVLHAMQRSSVVDSVEMVCLSADVRIGPLAPGACHVAELRFMALKAGVVGVEAVRVLDLGSSEHVDIRELPTVVIEERDDEGYVSDQ